MKEIANADTELAHEEREAALEKEITEHLCQEVLAMFPDTTSDEDSDRMSEDSYDEPIEYSINAIKRKMNEMNETLEGYKAETEKCYSVLGLTDCNYALPDVLETYKEKMTAENAALKDKLEDLKERIAFLEKRCGKLQEKLYNKDQEFKRQTHNRSYDVGTTEAEVRELRAKCHELEKKREDACKTLTGLVVDLSPPSRQIQHPVFSYDQIDGQGNGVHLPPLVEPHTSRAHTHRPAHTATHTRRARERSSLNFNEPRNCYGTPWK